MFCFVVLYCFHILACEVRRLDGFRCVILCFSWLTGVSIGAALFYSVVAISAGVTLKYVLSANLSIVVLVISVQVQCSSMRAIVWMYVRSLAVSFPVGKQFSFPYFVSWPISLVRF